MLVSAAPPPKSDLTSEESSEVLAVSVGDPATKRQLPFGKLHQLVGIESGPWFILISPAH